MLLLLLLIIGAALSRFTSLAIMHDRIMLGLANCKLWMRIPGD